MTSVVNQNRIVDEIATGVVNGANKIFTTANKATFIEQLKVNGTIYSQFTFVQNIITLDDAPTTGIVEVTYSYISNLDYNDNSGWIVGETLTGDSNGSNKVFTSIYPISYIDEVRVNGIATGSYSFLGNSILLVTAPSTSQLVEIDYFKKDIGFVDYLRDEYYTRKEIQTLIYDSISQDDTSAQYPQSLVNTAISVALKQLNRYIKDKSRNGSYTIEVGENTITPIVNSITTCNISNTEAIPNKGKLITKEGEIIDYTQLSSGIITFGEFNRLVNTNDSGDVFIGYRLPRNINRVIGVNAQYPIPQCGSIIDFINSYSGYLIIGGNIFIKDIATITIEIELKNGMDSDNSIVFVPKDLSYVIVDIALARLYRERESDKYSNAYNSSVESIKEFKANMRELRAKDGTSVISTVPFGATINTNILTRPPRQRVITKEVIGDLDGGTATN